MNTTHAQPTNKQIKPARPNAKPKRPLSAFNLFYRFKRQKIVEVLSAKGHTATTSKDAIRASVTAVPGSESEHIPSSALKITSPDVLNSHRRENIRKYLEQNMEPRDTKSRAHRKNEGAMNGAIGFVELGKLMNTSWKNCDPFAKSVFHELSEEGRARYRQRTAAYESRRQDIAPVKREGNAVSKSPDIDIVRVKVGNKKSTKKKSHVKKTFITKVSPPLSEKENARDYGTAKAIVQLEAPTTPSNTKNDNAAAAQSVLNLPYKSGLVGNKEAKNVPKNTLRDVSNRTSPAISSQECLTQHNIAAKVPAIRQWKGKNKDPDGIAINAMAGIATLENCSPPEGNGNKMCSSIAKIDNPMVGPSLLDLLVKKEIPSEADGDVGFVLNHFSSLGTSKAKDILPASFPNVPNEIDRRAALRIKELEYQLAREQLRSMSNDSIRPVRNNISVLNSSQDISPALFPYVPNMIDGRLMMRYKELELERQLERERLQAHIQAVEDNMSRRYARQGLLESLFDNAMTPNRTISALAPAVSDRPFMHDGLWGLVSTSMIHPSVRPSERAAMLSRIVESRQAAMPSNTRRPPSNMYQMRSPESIGEHPNTTQRFG
mmetsp:Transcript_3566/g.8002  ORF Transcript_3566/g.8002 Transcript_3566/m.8002 type:complete len:604 (+) Transcript_3566:118-1929(+)